MPPKTRPAEAENPPVTAEQAAAEAKAKEELARLQGEVSAAEEAKEAKAEPMVDTPFGQLPLSEALAKARAVAKEQSDWERLLASAKGQLDGTDVHRGEQGEICESCFPNGWDGDFAVRCSSVKCEHGEWTRKPEGK